MFYILTGLPIIAVGLGFIDQYWLLLTFALLCIPSLIGILIIVVTFINTFLIGENNVGKSSILYALDYLLNNKPKVNPNEYFSCTTAEGENKRIADEIILTAEFCDLPTEAKLWRGFKGRVIPSTDNVAAATGTCTYDMCVQAGGNVNYLITTQE